MKAPYIPKNTDYSEDLRNEEIFYEKINETNSKVFYFIIYYFL
jgi:hypothetical protein